MKRPAAHSLRRLADEIDIKCGVAHITGEPAAMASLSEAMTPKREYFLAYIGDISNFTAIMLA